MNEHQKTATHGDSEPTYDRRVTPEHFLTPGSPFEQCTLTGLDNETFAEVGSYTVRIFNDRSSCSKDYRWVEYQIDGGTRQTFDPSPDPVTVRKEADGPDRVIMFWFEECGPFLGKEGPASSARPPRDPSDPPDVLAPRVTLTLTKKGGF
jgi:hypothetical protein